LVTKTRPSHRPDIDGLRCLAILPVVLFHLGIQRISGGFVGVDIFFVISGYLITGIVARDTLAGRFTFASFYERRVRRIAPALAVVLALCSIGAYFTLLPGDLIQYGRSLAAALFSYSNFYFWTQSDYFKPTFVKLLLHTWSLSVEEQFYVVLPVTIVLLRNRWRLLQALLTVFAVVSLGFSTWLSLKYPEAGFYMPFSRAWELLIGSLLVICPPPQLKWRFANESLALLGLALIFTSILLFSKTTIFPGPSALTPCLGTALLLFSGERGTAVGKVLSLRPIAFIGLISYSVYLIHWPLILFSRMGVLPGHLHHTPGGQLLLLLGSLFLGVLSWRFVETPFRAGASKRWTRKRVWVGFATATATLLAVAISYLTTAGIPWRFPQRAIQLAQYLNQPQRNRQGVCFITTTDRFDKNFNPDICTASAPQRPTYLVAGDSHAAALWYGFTQALPQVHFPQITSSGCLPVRGSYDDTNCGLMRRFLYQQYLAKNKPDMVLLTARWYSAKELSQMGPTIRWLQTQQIPVTIIGPVQEYDLPLPMVLAFAAKKNDPDLPKRYELPEFGKLDSDFRKAAEELNVKYLSPRKQLCTGLTCREYADEAKTVPVLTDDNHLSYQAAELLVKKWIADGELRPARASDTKNQFSAITPPPGARGTGLIPAS
jgi:peptidoglycan/LPS O-acetylase OafA/YrhL